MLIVVFTSGSQLQPGGRGVTIAITIITIIITIIMFTSGSQLQPGGRGVLHWQSTHMSPIGHKLKTTFRSEIIRTQKKTRHLSPIGQKLENTFRLKQARAIWMKKRSRWRAITDHWWIVKNWDIYVVKIDNTFANSAHDFNSVTKMLHLWPMLSWASDNSHDIATV